MPPKLYSRHSYTYAYQDDSGDVVLSIPEPYRFRDFGDNRVVTVVEGETLFGIAGREFSGDFERPAGFWWIIADFQPEPIHDPTIRLEGGRKLYIPSVRTIREEIFSPSREA